MYPGIHNFSEIGKLNKVLLHRPGKELEALTPATLERLLFDDVPYLKIAQEEHDNFARVLRENGVEVVYYVDEVAKAIAGSTLFKAAVFGRDANWGRIMAAAGYSGADVDPTKADCIIKSSAGEVQVMKDGFGTDFSEELAKAVLTEHDITVIVDFHSGDGKAVAYGCDLTYEYVKINGDYRT